MMANGDADLKFHANQGLCLFLLNCVLGAAAFAVIVFAPGYSMIAIFIAFLVPFFLMLFGFFNAYYLNQGKLPLIGSLSFFK